MRSMLKRLMTGVMAVTMIIGGAGGVLAAGGSTGGLVGGIAVLEPCAAVGPGPETFTEPAMGPAMGPAAEPATAEGGKPQGLERSPEFIQIPGYEEFETLRLESQELRARFQANQETLKALVKLVKDTESLEAGEMALSYKDEAKALKEEQKTLGMQQKASWQLMKEAIKAGDAPGMEAAMQELIAGRQALNENLASSIDLQEEIISALNGMGIS